MFQISMMVPAFHVLFYFRDKLYDIILQVSTLRLYSRFFGKYFIWYFIGPGQGLKEYGKIRIGKGGLWGNSGGV